jgi:hypothetical protein
MMTAKRAGVFDTEDDLDVSGFAPKATDRPAMKPEQVRAVSEAAQFQSREPQRAAAAPIASTTTSARREPRRYRTGRNTQLNIKARTEAIDSFYEIADRQGWVLGETFERALEALRRELAVQS